MNKLRLYLILAILLVAFFPNPNRLFGEEYNGCHQYSSAFLHISWEYNTCAWGPWPGTIIIGTPGFLANDNIGFIEEIYPNANIFFAPTQSKDWLIWGGINQPRMGRDKNLVKDLHFKLSPEVNFCWLNTYTPFSDCWE